MEKFLIYLTSLVVALSLWTVDMVQPVNRLTRIFFDAPTYQEIQKRQYLTVGFVKNHVSYFYEKDKPQGFDYELSQAFADFLGVDLNAKEYQTVEELFSALENHNIDIAASNLMFDEQKTKTFLLGPSYAQASWQLVFNKNNRQPKNLQDLRADIVVSQSSGGNALLQSLKEQYPKISWRVENKTQEELLRSVAKGEIPYTLANSMIVASTQSLYPNATVAFDVGDEQSIHWYLAKTKEGDQTLQSQLLQFMDGIIEEGLLSRLDEKYVTHFENFNYVDTQSYLNAIHQTLPKYQAFFKAYKGELDWQLLAAVAYQESHWNPEATSPTGVRGMMMLTKVTAEFMKVKDRLDPAQSIEGGAGFLHYLLGKIPESVPKEDRIWYALMAYNMGLGHLYDVLKLTEMEGGNPDHWVDVKNNLPKLGKAKYYQKLKHGHARGIQAFQYVENIRRYLHILNHYERDETLLFQEEK